MGEQKGNNYRKHEKPSPGCQVPKVQVSDPLILVTARHPKSLGPEPAGLPRLAALIHGLVAAAIFSSHSLGNTRSLVGSTLVSLPTRTYPRPPTRFWSLAQGMSQCP